MATEDGRQNGWTGNLFNTLASSSIIGLSRVGSESSKILKLFWLLLFIIGVIGFSVNFNKIFIQLQQEPVLTQTNHEYKGFTWPHFTLCHSTNPIAFWKKPSLKQLWKSYHRNATLVMNDIWSDNVEFRKSIGELILASVDSNEFFNIGVRGSVMQLKLQYHNSKEIATTSVHYHSFRKISRFDSGFVGQLITKGNPIPCYTLKPELLFSNYSIRKLAEVGGIKIFLTLDFDSYRLFNIARMNELFIYVSNPDHTITSSHMLPIIAGTSSSIQITESKFIGLKDCRHRDYVVEVYDPLMQQSRQHLGGYEDCRFKLSQSLFYKRCGCYNPSLPIYKLNDSVPRLCLNMTIYKATEIVSNHRCIQNVKKEYDNGNTFESLVNKECGDYVKPKCARTTYSIDRQTRTWPRKINANLRKQMAKIVSFFSKHHYSRRNNLETFMFDNYAIVEFHRKEKMVKLTFEEWEYTIPKFLSDVGGLLGLWLGLSCIGIFELLDLIVRVILSPIIDLRNEADYI